MVVQPCAPTVLIGGFPAARVTDIALCNGLPIDVLDHGAPTVEIGGQWAARKGDFTAHKGAITTGFPTVHVGKASASAAKRFQSQPGKGSQKQSHTSTKGPLDSPKVKAAMKKAWKDSQANDSKNRHEEGGYIVKNPDGSYDVERWPSGGRADITPPQRAADGTYNGKQVVGEFHTHPNPDLDEKGQAWQEAPHKGDLNGVRNEKYPGDSYVIGHKDIHRVDNTGATNVVGARGKTLGH